MEEIELKVDGMMCSGCENRIKNALKNIEGVEEVEASYNDKLVKIILNKSISKESIKEVIIDLGYQII